MLCRLLSAAAIAAVILTGTSAQAGSGVRVISGHGNSHGGSHYTRHYGGHKRHHGLHASTLAAPSYCRIREVYVDGLTYSRLDCRVPPGLPFAQPEQPWAYTYFRDKIQWDQSPAWQSHLQPGPYSPNYYWGY